MDEQFRKPVLIMLWAVTITVVMYAVLFIIGMILGVASPETFV